MKGRHLIGLPAVTLVAIASLGAGDPKQSPRLEFRASYDTGLAANGSEIISVRHSDGIAALTNVDGSVDVLDLSNPVVPRFVRRVTVDTTAGTPNSVAVHPQHDYFLVVLGRAGQVGQVASYGFRTGSSWIPRSSEFNRIPSPSRQTVSTRSSPTKPRPSRRATTEDRDR